MDVKETLDTTMDKAKDAAEEMADKAKDIAEDAADKAKDMAEVMAIGTKDVAEGIAGGMKGAAEEIAGGAKEAIGAAMDTVMQAKDVLDADGNGKLTAQEVLGGLGARIDKTVVAAGSFADEIKQAFDADGNGKVESDELGAVAKSAAAFIGTTARAAVAGVQGVVSGVADKTKEIVDEAK